MPEPTVIAVDWSGNKQAAGQRKGICVAVADSDADPRPSQGRTRAQTIEYIEQLPAPCVVGIDMSFGVPAWFARQQGCSTIGELWVRATDDGERWIGPPPTDPFWNAQCIVSRERQYRACEESLKRKGVHPASIFALVGAKTVGVGSVRGMPYLARLHAAGFAIWPFDAPSDRTVVEIYPTILRLGAPAHLKERTYDNEHVRDAVCSAATMWKHRASFANLTAATDPVTLLEGDVWTPPGF